jgi:hypothetical protein
VVLVLLFVDNFNETIYAQDMRPHIKRYSVENEYIRKEGTKKAGGNQIHDEDLVVGRLCNRRAAKDLSRHHPCGKI